MVPCALKTVALEVTHCHESPGDSRLLTGRQQKFGAAYSAPRYCAIILRRGSAQACLRFWQTLWDALAAVCSIELDAASVCTTLGPLSPGGAPHCSLS